MDYVFVKDDQAFTIEQIAKMMNDDIIDRLVAYRELSHKTRQQIADAIGVPLKEIERIERKESVTPVELLMKYADSLGLELRFEASADKKITNRRPLPIGPTFINRLEP